MPSKPILLPQHDIFQSETEHAKKKNKIEDGTLCYPLETDRIAKSWRRGVEKFEGLAKSAKVFQRRSIKEKS